MTDTEFWQCAQDGVRPHRGEPVAPADAPTAELVFLLISRVGVDEAMVAAMTKDQAVAELNRYWAKG